MDDTSSTRNERIETDIEEFLSTQLQEALSKDQVDLLAHKVSTIRKLASS